MQVTFVCGSICSGKSTLIETSFIPEDTEIISVSDIVRSISQLTDRKDLSTKTADLDVQIAQKIFERITAVSGLKSEVVIDGVRQYSIIEEIYRKINQLRDFKQFHISFIWKAVDPQQAEMRFEFRKDKKDNALSYKEALDLDEKLGMYHLRSMLLLNHSNHLTIYH